MSRRPGGGLPGRRRPHVTEVVSERGQASVLVVGALVAVALGALVLGLVARGGAREARAQRAADLGALAAARAMHDAYARLFEPVFADRERPGAEHLGKAQYLALGRAAAVRVAQANGAAGVRVAFPDGATFAPVRVRVTVRDVFEVRAGDARRTAPIEAAAEAALAPPGELAVSGGGYDGPLATRQGERMRPDVARAFDRMERAARARGVGLIITSGYRSDAEQAILFARHPDPRWVAPPGRSLHRLGTELDLGPPSAYGWLAANAQRFHFTQRYSWELSQLCSGCPPGWGPGGGRFKSCLPDRENPAYELVPALWLIRPESSRGDDLGCRRESMGLLARRSVCTSPTADTPGVSSVTPYPGDAARFVSAARTSAASCSPVMPASVCTLLLAPLTLSHTRSAISGG